MSQEAKIPVFTERFRLTLLERRVLVLDGVLDDDNGTLLAAQFLTLADEDPAADIALWMIRRTPEQHRLCVARGECLSAQMRERGGGIGGVLFGRQHLVARSASESISRSVLAIALLAECNQILRRGHLLLERRRVEGREHDTRGKIAAGRFELVGLLLDLSGERAIRKHRGAEKIEGVGRLHFSHENILEERFLRQYGQPERALPCGRQGEIHARHQVLPDLRAQLFSGSLEGALRRRQRRAVREPLGDPTIELGRLEGLPPGAHRASAEGQMLRHAVRTRKRRRLGEGGVVLGRRHPRRVALGAKG